MARSKKGYAKAKASAAAAADFRSALAKAVSRKSPTKPTEYGLSKFLIPWSRSLLTEIYAEEE